MLTFIVLLLIFLYFKIARVHNKQESKSYAIYMQHAIVALSAFFVYQYAFNHYAWYTVFILSFISFIIAGLAITAVQVGIFIEGKPLFGMSFLFKYIYVLTALIVVMTIILGKF